MGERKDTEGWEERVRELGSRVESWRRSRRYVRAAMPAELWLDAAVLARSYGVYRVSRALGIDSVRLKKRALEISEACLPARPTTSGRFVEISGLGQEPRNASGEIETELEVESPRGMRLRVRQCGPGVDLSVVVEAFCRGAR